MGLRSGLANPVDTIDEEPRASLLRWG